MKVSKLIEQLKTMPPDAFVGYVYDGEVRCSVDMVYRARSGVVVLAGEGEYVYTSRSRPTDAPGDEEERWDIPKSEISDEERAAWDEE